MRIVLDTNVLLASLPKFSRYRPIIDALATGRAEWVVSTAILLEYQEVLTNKTNILVATNFLEFLTKLPGLVRVGTPYSWQIITKDWDDNKFVDAGLIAGADFIVTNDAHFNEVKNSPFPSIRIISAEEFLDVLKREEP
ncbi:putative toxin-antitoxin system toxin component, PIN family [Larkinella soli]|uniref:putative toxin-antitoxin system toxin component, PIN family n=1 Tax=Larkinella soli TaxID=1770527 RepID=UPI000FFCBBB7|nr:putative toxin-antitoxin system toxin component, PIN family [Larkinella soli]